MRTDLERATGDQCANCPDGYDCSTGNYYTGDVLISDPKEAHVEALYEDIYREWPEPRLRDLGDGYVQAERGDLEEMLRRGEDRG